MMISPSLNDMAVTTSARAEIAWSERFERLGTSRRNPSYSRRLPALASTMSRRKVCRSSAQTTDGSSAVTVAARGALYMSASSPKEPPGPTEMTFTAGCLLRETKMSNVPDSTT
eukprot:Amastigsp_a678691_348.p3 type:complete len:114 gc:universal Amastigsp_a678691_348:912-571(-)